MPYSLSNNSSSLFLLETDWMSFWGALKSSDTIVLYVSMSSRVVDKKWCIRMAHWWGLQADWWNLLGYSFIIKGTVEQRRRPLSFLSRHHASIISSSSRLGREISLFLHGQARSTNYCFFNVCRECVLGSLTCWAHGQHVGLIPPMFYCFGAYLMLLSHGFVAKQACMVLWLSKPDFLSNH